MLCQVESTTGKSNRVASASLLAILGATNCQSQGYRPVAPHVATRPELTVTVDRINFGQAFSASLTLKSAAPVLVRRVLLAPADAEPCHEGIRESDARLDHQRIWARPFEVNGVRELDLRFGVAAASQIVAQPAAFDLVLAQQGGQPDQCLRVALTSQARDGAWNADVRGTVAMTVRVESPAYGVNGVDTGWSFDTRIGGYAGPLRIMGEVGLGGAHCGERCFGSSIGFVWLPLGVSTHWFAYDSKGSALDVGVAYRLMLAGVGHGQDSRSLLIQAPELRLRWANTVQRGPGLPGGPRIGSGGFELFASEWFSKGPSGPERSFVLGFGIVGDTGF